MLYVVLYNAVDMQAACDMRLMVMMMMVMIGLRVDECMDGLCLTFLYLAVYILP